MIFVDNENITEDMFTSLLEETKAGIIKTFGESIPKGINGNVFESAVHDQMLVSSIQTDFEGHIVQTGTHSFPDIIARKLYGVEVKMTIGDKWVSTGNSVLESTRIEDVETIYMFFGKFGKDFNVKYRKYQDCLYDVGVTHSPRYKIDMTLPDGHSIFHKLGVSYDEFRKDENSINRLKQYYKSLLKSGEELWWISDTQEDVAVSPIIQSLGELSIDIREKIIIECFILFPEIFGSSGAKFERAAAYLITNYNAVSSHLRDYFTAGGRKNIVINGTTVNVSRLVYNFFIRAKHINHIIQQIPFKQLNYYWNTQISGNPVKYWKSLLKHNSTENIDVIEVFNEGLKL